MYTAAELVYGTTLRLPGDFFLPSTDSAPIDPVNYVSQLRDSMQCVQAPPTRPAHRHSYVSDALATVTHVFVRHDAVRKPLQQPYDGPYEVVKRNDKYFTININGRHNTVSLDRLKPAHLDLIPPDTGDISVTNQILEPLHNPNPTSTILPIPAPTPPTPTQGTTTTPVAAKQVTLSVRHVHWPKRLELYVH